MSNESTPKGKELAAPSPDKTDPALKILRTMYVLTIVIFLVAGMAGYFLLSGNMVVALSLICLNIALALVSAGLVLVLLARRVVEWRLFAQLPKPSGRRVSEKRP
ncbi:hypothetical protein [Arthrobacter sp. TMN-50]